MFFRLAAHVGVIIVLLPGLTFAGQPVTRQEATGALKKAVQFFRCEVSTHGGYLWRYSGDLKLREGEGKASETMAWVQPPGTPTVGQAFLDAYEATGEKLYLDAARDTAEALLRGQLRSGGWDYRIEFDPENRQRYGYRDNPARQGQRQKTTLDDNTSQSAVRFLMRIDEILKFKDKKIHEAVTFALDSMIKAQFPNGGWDQWWDQLPSGHSPQQYPLVKASYPESWPRVWPNDWTGCYFLNDNVMGDMIVTMLDAYETYGEKSYLTCALKAGDFLLLAQMPQPQPAWAQQYDLNMHPVWDRKFEPPAISGGESQGVMETLMLLSRKTAKPKYLEPIPRAIRYFRGSQLSGSRLARFYELKTNKPLFFTKDYKLTYSSDDMPTHYGFIVDSRLDRIEARYRTLLSTALADTESGAAKQTVRLTPALIRQTRTVIDRMDERGAWVERGQLRYHKIEPASGIIDCQTFVNNISILCRFLTANK